MVYDGPHCYISCWSSRVPYIVLYREFFLVWEEFLKTGKLDTYEHAVHANLRTPWHTYCRMNVLTFTYTHLHSLTLIYTDMQTHARNNILSSTQFHCYSTIYYNCCNLLYCVLEGFCFCYIYHITVVKCTCDTLLFMSITVLWLVHVIQVLWCDWFMLRRHSVLIGSRNFHWLVSFIGWWSLFRIVFNIVWTFQASLIFKTSPLQTL